MDGKRQPGTQIIHNAHDNGLTMRCKLIDVTI